MSKNDVEKDVASDIPVEYKPITMWGYFGFQILFAIPIVGLICLIIFAFGGTSNINLRNYARSYFCTLILFVILLIVLSLLGISYSSLIK